MNHLFLVNRAENVGKEISKDEEKLKLDKILTKIAHKKKYKERKRENIARTLKKRRERRERTEHIVQIPENSLQEFVDEPIDDGPPTPTKKKKTTQKSNGLVEGFTILGGDVGVKKAKVRRVLPHWLSHPTVISSDLHDLKTKVANVKQLDKSIRKRLKANGVECLFPVQAAVIPWLLHVNRHSDVVFPQDLCVSAPTGNGKTLAFVLPIVQTLMRTTTRRVRALVILPTQTLADQVFKTFKTYTQGTNLEVCLMTTTNSFETEHKLLVDYNEAFGYSSKADIVVCTAGRLVFHLKSTEGFDLRNLEFLVIDEADRVLETVQNDWLYHLEKHLDCDDDQHSLGKVLNLFTLNQGRRPPQKLLFSATLSSDPEKLEKLSLFQPKLFTVVGDDVAENHDDDKIKTFVGKYATPKELTEKYIICSKEFKPLVLYKFIETEQLTKTLIFTHSIESTHRLTILLRSLFQNKKNVEEISSNLKTKNRNELIQKFAKGQIDILICTDSLARGIDLPGIQCVISYSAPKYAKTYIHRSGRTARAGENGVTVTLIHQKQVQHFESLLKQLEKDNDVDKMEMPAESLKDLGYLYKKALIDLKKAVQFEQKRKVKKVMSVKKHNKLVKINEKQSQ